GHGAPLAPLLDQLLLGADERGRTAVLNIGGISNLSLVGGVAGDEVLSGDLGPGNALLDAAVHAATGRAADVDAALARTGTVDAAALATLLRDPFYTRPLPRSTGREHFDSTYVRRVLGEEAFAALALPDLLATLTELTAVTIAEAIRPLGASRVVISGGGLRTPLLRDRPAALLAPLPAVAIAGAVRPLGASRVVISGGGMRNPLLRDRLAALLAPVPLRDADDLGIPADGKEALLIALLGHHGAHGLPGTLARADGTAHTGARTPAVLGSLTPPHTLRSLPREPGHEHTVDRLVIVTDDGEERS